MICMQNEFLPSFCNSFFSISFSFFLFFWNVANHSGLMISEYSFIIIYYLILLSRDCWKHVYVWHAYYAENRRYRIEISRLVDIMRIKYTKCDMVLSHQFAPIAIYELRLLRSIDIFKYIYSQLGEIYIHENTVLGAATRLHVDAFIIINSCILFTHNNDIHIHFSWIQTEHRTNETKKKKNKHACICIRLDWLYIAKIVCHVIRELASLFCKTGARVYLCVWVCVCLFVHESLL